MGQKKQDDDAGVASPLPKLSFIDSMKAMRSNFKYTTVLCCFKAKKQTKVSSLEFQILQLKKKFGVDYLTLVSENAPVEDLKDCLKTALEELSNLQEEIDDTLDEIDEKEHKVNEKISRTKSADELFGPNKNKTVRSKPKQKKSRRVDNSEKESDWSDDDGSFK